MTIHSSHKHRFLPVTTGLLISLLVSLFFLPVAHAQGKKKASAEAPVKAAEIPVKAEEIPVKAEPTKAESAPAAKEAADAEPAKVKVERGAGGRKIYKIEGEIVIEGKIQKPEAFYVLQKSSINYDWHELKQEFVPKILDSVTKAPF